MKYNWKELKADFMASDYRYVKRWWRDYKKHPVSGHFYHMTSGWHSEKWRLLLELRNSSFLTQ